MLGNDVVIADAQVAEVYFQCLQPISTQKYLISDTGAFEFAKRFCVKGGRVDLSAMSARCLLAYQHPYGWWRLWGPCQTQSYKISSL